MSVDKIIAALPGKTAEACDRIRQNALRLRTEGNPQQQKDAEALLDALAVLEQPGASTPYDALSGEEVNRRVARALTRHPLTEVEAMCLQALLDNPGAPSEKLSAACGWKGTSWQIRFGGLCRDRQADLWPIEGGVQNWGKPFYSGLFADFDSNGSRFTLRPKVQAALAELGVVPKTASADNHPNSDPT